MATTLQKGLNVFCNASMDRVNYNNRCLDGASVLSRVRVGGDAISLDDIYLPLRMAYIPFGLIPVTSQYPNLSQFLLNLPWTPDGGWGSGADVTRTNVDAATYSSEGHSFYYLTDTGRPSFGFTASGLQKIHAVVDKVCTKLNLNTIGAAWFGLPNEPNNAAGFTAATALWWPMKARVYAAFYEALVGAVRDYMLSRWGRNPSFSFGESSYFFYVPNSESSYQRALSGANAVLTQMGEYKDKVPSPPQHGHVDYRYPNLFLRYYIDDMRPPKSPGGNSLGAQGITFHLYNNSLPRPEAAPPNDAASAMNALVREGMDVLEDPTYLTGYYYGNTVKELTEFGFEAPENITGDVATRWLEQVWPALDDVRNYRPNFYGAYWYADICGVSAGAKVVFRSATGPTSDCALTSPTNPVTCSDIPAIQGVCGEALKALYANPVQSHRM